MSEPLEIAIQKEGRLTALSKELLAKTQLLAGTKFAPFSIRDDDIPLLVSEGMPFGIVGKNVYLEWALGQRADALNARTAWLPAAQDFTTRILEQSSVAIYRMLGFHKCSLMIAVPKEVAQQGRPNDGWLSLLQDQRIATSFPNILTNFLQDVGVQERKVMELEGQVEKIGRKLKAGAILEIVDSGNTLREFDWVPVYKVMDLEPVLIGPASVKRSSPERDAFLAALEEIEGVRMPPSDRDIYANGRGELSLDDMKPYLTGPEMPAGVVWRNSSAQRSAWSATA